MNTLNREYPCIVVPDVLKDGTMVWYAKHPDLPGCAATGATETLAKASLAQAREAYILDLTDSGLPVPPPSSLDGAPDPTREAIS